MQASGFHGMDRCMHALGRMRTLLLSAAVACDYEAQALYAGHMWQYVDV